MEKRLWRVARFAFLSLLAAIIWCIWSLAMATTDKERPRAVVLLLLALAFLVVATTAAFVASVQRGYDDAQREERLRRSQCPQCGYDLRASVGQCPECGHPIQVTAPAQPVDTIDTNPPRPA